ncbi:MAG: CHAT domain-containing protein, partial [Ginsengibacter sp.]
VKDLEEDANTLEKDLTRLSSAFKNQQAQNNITWKNIQQNLKPNEAAIEFVDFNFYNGKRYTDSTYYIALLLRKDKPEPQLIKLFEKKQLDSILLNKGNDENEIITNFYGYPKNTLEKSLYDIIWKPIEKSLTGITKIYFAPSGNLHKLAFAALPIGNNKVLSDKYQLVELNTTASVTNQVPFFIDTTDNIQLFGGVQYDADSTELKQVVNLYASNKDNLASRSVPDDLDRGGTFNYLPGTQTEIESIKQQSAAANNHVKILSGIDATEESFKALNGNASPAVIHIATHGFFFPDPKENKDKAVAKFETSGKVFKQSDNPLFRSGLAFAGANYEWTGKPIKGIEDGILTAYEVSNMYLPNTKLVVLSACETALGDIEGSEGVYGLQRAFKIAGVKNLVMSLWKVPDRATAEFMQIFYKNLFSKQSLSDAFYHAQTTMKNKYRDDPYKWAAWVLIR